MKKEFTWDVAHSLWFYHPKSVALNHGALFKKDNNIHEAILQFYLIKEHSKKMAQVEKLKEWIERNTYNLGNVYSLGVETKIVGAEEIKTAIDEIFRN